LHFYLLASFTKSRFAEKDRSETQAAVP